MIYSNAANPSMMLAAKHVHVESLTRDCDIPLGTSKVAEGTMWAERKPTFVLFS